MHIVIMSLMLICKLSTPLNVFISNTPATSILSPILYSFAKYPILNPIAMHIVIMATNVENQENHILYIH